MRLGINLLLGNRLQHCYKRTPLPLFYLLRGAQSPNYDDTPERQDNEYHRLFKIW